MYIRIMLKKGYIFHFCCKVSGLHFCLTPRRIILYCEESAFFIRNFEYLDENETKFENILTHWSVAQAAWFEL